MDSLKVLINCCRSADLDKATDRKNAISTLYQELKLTPVFLDLDKASDNNNSVINWNQLFRFVTSVIFKEINSSSARSSKEKKLQNCGELFKFFIRIAENRGPQLKTSDILKHIINILDDLFLNPYIINDYSIVLLKCILISKKHLGAISLNMWQELIDRYCHYYLEFTNTKESGLVARVICSLFKAATHWSSLKLRRWLPFFTEVFKSVRNECSSHYESLLLSLLACSRSIAADNRIQICKLGEEIMTVLLNLWTYSNSVKEVIAEFFILQMAAHHPGGANSEKNGGFACNYKVWQNHLWKMYNILHEELQQSAQRSKFTGVKDSTLKPLFLELAALVYTQIYNRNDDSLEPSTSKKPHLEADWNILIEILKSNSNSEGIVWLHLLESILRQFFKILPKKVIIEFTTVLQQMLQDCQRNDFASKIFSCLTLVAHHQKKLHYSGWQKIWLTAVQFVTSNRTVSEAWALFHCLLSHQLVAPDQEFFQIFSAGTFLDKSLFDILILCLQQFHFLSNRNKCSIREELLNWLLPHFSDLHILNCVEDVECLANLLVILCFCNLNVTNSCCKNDETTWLQSLEHLYLQTAFITSTFAEEKKHAEEIEVNNGILKEIKLKIMLNFKHKCQRLLETCCHPEILKLQALLYIIHLLVQFSRAANQWRLFSIDEETYHDQLQKLVKRFSSLLWDFMHRDSSKKMEDLLKILTNLHQMASRGHDITYVMSTLSPGKLPALLFAILDNKFANPTQSKINNDEQLLDECQMEIDNNEANAASYDDLTSYQKLCLLSVQILGEWCCYADDGKSVRQKLFNLYSNNWDPSSRYGFQLLFLRWWGDELSSPELSLLLDALRRCLKINCKDPKCCVQCLNLLKDWIPFLKISTEENRNLSLFLVKTIWELQLGGKGNQSTLLALMDCFQMFLSIDPSNSWISQTSSEDEEETFSIPDSWISLLSHSSHIIRMKAIHQIPRLFDQQTLHTQNSYFKAICTSLEMLLQSKVTQVDERQNRISSVLFAISTIACYSPYFEKAAVFFLYQLCSQISPGTISKVLNHVSLFLGYSSVQLFSKSHLGYLIERWLKEKCPISNFPFQLLCCSHIKEFYELFSSVLIPYLIRYQDVSVIKSIAKEMKCDWIYLLKQSFPQTIVFILPLFAAQSSQSNHENSLLMQGSLCHQLLEDALGKKTINELLMVSLVLVITELLLMVYDDLNEESQHLKYPAPNPPYYSSYTIQATLNYLCECCALKEQSVAALLAKQPDGIQNILLNLTVHMCEATRAHDRRRLFLAYRLFIKLLLKDFGNGLGGCWAFVLRDVIYRMINEIRNESSVGTTLCCSLLQDVCLTALKSAPQELGKHLHVIVSGMIPLINGPASKEALGLLKLLIITHDSQLQTFISCLDPFPQTKIFEDINKVYLNYKYLSGPFTLKQEINHFLKVGKLYPMAARLEGIRFLKQQLSTCKKEFFELVRDSESSSLLLELVRYLMQLSISCQNNSSFTCEIASCLGELGPINLSTIVLQNKESFDCIFTSWDYQKIYIIVHLLNSYLIESSVDSLQASCEVLKKILNTQLGQNFALFYKTQNSDHMLQYLQPFRSRRAIPLVETTSTDCFTTLIDQMPLWTPSNGDHDKWIQDLSCALIKCGIIKDQLLLQLLLICQKKVNFCEKVLPFLVHDVLVNGTPFHRQILSSHIQKLFQDFSQQAKPSLSQGSSSALIPIQSVRCMLEVVKYLQMQTNSHLSNPTAWDSNFWLDLDYLLLAQVAQDCSAYFTSLLFIEIWYQLNKTALYEKGIIQVCPLDKLDSSNIGKEVQTLLLKAYHYIGDPDAVYGCGSKSMTKPLTRIYIYDHECRWEEALPLCDMNYLHLDDQTQLFKVMQQLGLVQTINFSLKGMQQANAELDPHLIDYMYECAWRCSMWDEVFPSRHSTVEFHQALYCSVTSLEDEEQILLQLNNCRYICLNSIWKTSLESTRTVYTLLSKLYCINILQEFSSILRSDFSSLSDLLNKWDLQDMSFQNDFEYLEPSLSLRCSLFEMLYKRQPSEPILNALSKQLLKKVHLARKAKHFQLAERELQKLHQLQSVNCHVHLEEAKLYWARAEFTTAKHLIRQIILSQEEANMDCSDIATAAQALELYGKWLAETHSESPFIILSNNFEKALNLLLKSDLRDQAVDTHLTIARFADSQYKSITNYMNSSDYEAKYKLMQRAKEDLDKIRQLNVNQSRYSVTLAKQSEMDEKELEGLTGDKNNYLEKAVHHYLCCLKMANRHDLWLFRLISLWFHNSGNDIITHKIEESIASIPSFKFLALIYQLAARLSTKSDFFQTILTKLIEKVTAGHPHHALYCIFALSNANKDAACVSRTSKMAHQEDRVVAAQNVLCRLKNVVAKDLLSSLEDMCNAYIQFAYQDHKDSKANTISKNLLIAKMKNRTSLPVPTLTLKIDPSGCYDNISYVVEFGSTFYDPGGINHPKVITCIGSDGVKYRQLLKAKDDLRQDAVMQQVFTFVNSLLHKNEETHQRKLSIRGYKVIPLTRCCGVVEWCEETQPLGEYLIGSKSHPGGAHKLYFPNDWPAVECRKKMQAVSKKSLGDRLNMFLTICNNLHPVFSHFFFEKYQDPAEWFDCRLAYIRSVATCSIVGYILGLGDRHVQNILIDKKHAELIHIDLGVAFEQGKILPTPETVPFRLTRDLVDGMGISGVEGVFRRCCEKTMEVMRGSQEALLTILEVLLYDPLYVWTISPLKALTLQQSRKESDLQGSFLTSDILADKEGLQEDVNKLAQRVLLRLQQKLEGIEESNVLSISGQVNRLIEEARNPLNLCRLFDGWQPFL